MNIDAVTNRPRLFLKASLVQSSIFSTCAFIAMGCASDTVESESAHPSSTPSGGLMGRVTPRIAVELVTDEVSANGTLLVVIDGEARVPDNMGRRPHVYSEGSTGLDAEPLYSRDLGEAYQTTMRFLERRYSFLNPQENSEVMFDYSSSCWEGCLMRFYFSEERITDASDRAAFWEESPERWRSAELQFQWEDIATNTYLTRYDDETADVDGALGTLLVDATGGDLSVAIMPMNQSMHDYNHRRYVGEPDVDEGGAFGSDADAGNR